MNKRRWVFLSSAALLLAGVAVYSYQRGTDSDATRATMLVLMPSDANYVVFADLAEIRTSPFVAELYKWAPQPPIDAEYARFLGDTGFDYERDLDRVAFAVIHRGSDTFFFAIADGRFDHHKIEAYVLQSGSRLNRNGHQILLMPAGESLHQLSFTFLNNDRMALTDSADLPALLGPSAKDEDSRQWQERFERLAGSPIFAVIRQDASLGSALAAQAPSGLQSPQLATLLNELLWITVAGKPDVDSLRIVAEGEYSDDRAARQLSDVLNGMVLLAQAGLNGPDTRHQVDPNAREAYLDILRGTDISQIDRGDTKSVRLIFDVTPKLLDAAKFAPPVPPASSATPDSAQPSAHAKARSHRKKAESGR